MDCLTFNNENDAIVAMQQIDTNAEYPKIGINAKTGKLEPDRQQTITWDEVKKANEIDKWYFTKPSQENMTDISAYSEEEFNPEWIEQGV